MLRENNYLPRFFFYRKSLFKIVFGQILFNCQPVFSSPEQKAQGELIVYQSSRRLAVCLWTSSNSNISTTSGPIITKF